MSVLSIDAARNLARENLLKNMTSKDDELIIREEEIEEGWMFVYQSKKYLGGDHLRQLRGHTPIIVTRDGVVYYPGKPQSFWIRLALFWIRLRYR